MNPALPFFNVGNVHNTTFVLYQSHSLFLNFLFTFFCFSDLVDKSVEELKRERDNLSFLKVEKECFCVPSEPHKAGDTDDLSLTVSE